MEEHNKHCCCHKHGTQERKHNADGKAHEHCCCHHGHEGGHSCCGEVRGGVLSTSTRILVSFAALAAGFSIPFFDLNFPFYPYSDPSWIAVFLCSGWIFRGMFKSLARREITVSILVGSAMTAAIALFAAQVAGFDTGDAHCHGYIFVAGEIAFLMTLGEWLEDRTIDKTKDGLKKISSLMPEVAKVIVEGRVREIPAAEIRAGDIVLINPRETISADGVVVSGSSTVNEANMTGESAPVEKNVGDRVLCGTFNENAKLEIRATKNGGETALSKTIELVREAEGKHAPIAHAAEKWAKIIVKSALATAVIVFFAAYFAFGTSLADAAIRATTILVVFCPCAFVLATPTAVSAAIGNAAKYGILVKSGEVMEAFAKVNAVFFDKTGTLTEGNIRVAGFEPKRASDAGRLLAVAAALESASKHPLAKAVAEYAAGKISADKIPAPQNLQIAANGEISAEIDGAQYAIKKAHGANATASDLFENGEGVARFTFGDTIRPSAKAAVEALKKSGCQCTILSGDNAASVKALAQNAGIENARHDLLPQDKLEAIAKAQQDGKFVCMVGDGVNDAPSLAAADVSVAIADLKNDIAVNSAQVALLNSDLTKIPALVGFSRLVLKTIYTNIAFSLCVSLLGISFGAAGLISPAWGALLHNVSSVAVVANSSRLLGSKFLGKKM